MFCNKRGTYEESCCDFSGPGGGPAVGEAPYDNDDVANGHWAAGCITKAVELSIVSGYGGNCFGPTDLVTVQQAAKCWSAPGAMRSRPRPTAAGPPGT